MTKKNNVVSIATKTNKTKTLTNTQLFSLTYHATPLNSGMDLGIVTDIFHSLQTIATAVAKTVFNEDTTATVEIRQAETKVQDRWFASMHLHLYNANMQTDLFEQHTKPTDGLTDFAQVFSLFLELLFTQFTKDDAQAWLSNQPISERLAKQWVQLISDIHVRRAGYKLLKLFVLKSLACLEVAVHEQVKNNGYSEPLLQFELDMNAIHEALRALEHNPNPDIVLVEEKRFDKITGKARIANLHTTSQWKLRLPMGDKVKAINVEFMDAEFSRFLKEEDVGITKNGSLQVDLLVRTYYNPLTEKHFTKYYVTKVHRLSVGYAEDYVGKQKQLDLLTETMQKQVAIAKATRAIRDEIAERASVEIGA